MHLLYEERRIRILRGLLFLSYTPAFAGVQGHWEGAFTRNGAVQTVGFDFRMTDLGLVGTYDIPDVIL